MNKLLLLLILSGLTVKAQPYYKMLGSSTTDWYIFQAYIPVSNANKTTSSLASTPHNPTWGKYTAKTDTLVSGNLYKKLYHVYMFPGSPINSHIGYIREDTAARKVYYMDKANTYEDLIYDFSLAVGDSVALNFPNTTGNFPNGYYKVKAITTVTTPLGLRNMFKLLHKAGSSTSDTLRYIESVGCEIHPIYANSSSYVQGQFTWAFTGCSYEYALGVACKYTNLQKVFQSCTYVTAQSNGCIFKYDSCNYWNTCSGINELDLVRNFDVSPNPSVGSCKITIGLATSLDLVIEVYDVVGRKVKTVNYGKLNEGEQQLDLDLNSFNSGLYYIKAKGKDFELHKPVVIEH